MLQGEPRSVTTEIDQHFDASVEAAMQCQDLPLETLLRWQHVGARRMAANSIWWVAHSMNSRVLAFVENVTRVRSMFELLPPQRAALVEQGLLDQASRAIVVDLPTSGGKTVLAEFRILQALNQFDVDEGWVAYVAPTRALVNQIARRLRSDFSPLGIVVEQLTPAIEVDAIEEQLLSDATAASSFHVLVTTPEKLDLVIRNEKTTRPLALMVMDEAHNIEDEDRGLRIELLLATIKRDSPSTQFLLLMPFVPNAADIAKWLAPESGRTVSLGTTAWQPNDRMITMYQIERDVSERGGWRLITETLATSRNTLELPDHYRVGATKPLNLSFSKAKSSTTLTGAMAKVFSSRGTSVAVARRIVDVWSMARTVAADLAPVRPLPSDIELVQRFLATEISPQFELISLLDKGVGVHHAGLSDDARTLVESLAEGGLLRVLCSTTTIAQGINFPVASVFLASRHFPYGKEMSSRTFWNLAGRAGRIDHDSVGVVGLAAGSRPHEIRSYVAASTGDLVSRLEKLLDELEASNQLGNLVAVLQQDQWADFRSYVAHLWKQRRDLEAVLAESEQLLRNTYGYGALQGRSDESSRRKARALLEATRYYAHALSEHPENATLADATGFAPEGVRAAILSMRDLADFDLDAWKPGSLFATGGSSRLHELIGVMMRVPEIRRQLGDLGAFGDEHARIANIAQDWVAGVSLEDIARTHFSELTDSGSLTDALTATCRGIYRTLTTAGSWGLAALAKLPTSGLNFENLSEDDRRTINALPALLYHGVSTLPAVMMRINSVPRSIAVRLGDRFHVASATFGWSEDVRRAREFVRALSDEDWAEAAPANVAMSGADYKAIWHQLSGEP
jgi:hypothetical protein